jgi:hypothetical protein
MMNSRFFGALMVWMGAAVSISASPVLTLTPSGDVSGTPGSTVGWGFTITNDANYMEITSSQYCVNPVNFPVVCNPSALGMYNDFIGPNGTIVGPPGGTDPDTVSQSFDPIAMTGVGNFVINALDLVNSGDTGQIVLTYELYNLDPNDPNAVPLDNGQEQVLSANASVTVTGSSVPEPGTAGLMAAALAGLAVGLRKRIISRNLLKRGPFAGFGSAIEDRPESFIAR